jgi:hypothetical protein
VVPIRRDLAAVMTARAMWLVDGAGRDLVVRNPPNGRADAGVVSGTHLLACDDAGSVRAIDLSTGRQAWWAQVSAGSSECRVFGATDDTALVKGAGRIVALDTTVEAPPAQSFTIRGRFKNVYSKGNDDNRATLHIDGRRVVTDKRGRFAATVRSHGPVVVSVEESYGPEGSVIVWPDSKDLHHVSLSNYYESDSCH